MSFIRSISLKNWPTLYLFSFIDWKWQCVSLFMIIRIIVEIWTNGLYVYSVVIQQMRQICWGPLPIPSFVHIMSIENWASSEHIVWNIILIFTSFLGTSCSNQTVRKLAWIGKYFIQCGLKPGLQVHSEQISFSILSSK